jgi:hypothetical protein
MVVMGYEIDESMLVCLECAKNPDYAGAKKPVEEEGYPDGFTCPDCGRVVL